MFSLRQAFNAGCAGLCGASLLRTIETNRPEEAVFEGLLLVANVVMAGMSTGRSPG